MLALLGCRLYYLLAYLMHSQPEVMDKILMVPLHDAAATVYQQTECHNIAL